MAARAPSSGGSVQAGGTAEPVTAEYSFGGLHCSWTTLGIGSGQMLQEVERLLASRKPWPAFVQAGLQARYEWNNCPEAVGEALEWMASATVGLLDMASVGPLTPVCKAFTSLIEAAEGAIEVAKNLEELVSWCSFLVGVFIEHGKQEDNLRPIAKPMKDFVATTIELAKRAKAMGARGKCTALLCHRRDGKQVQDFDVKLRHIWDDIQGVTLLAFYSDFRATLPPKTAYMARVPKNAKQLPPAFVERRDLFKAVVKDLVATDRATNAAHVLRGMPGGGKTIAAKAVVRCEDVRRSFKDGIFWVQVGQVGTGNPMALLQGLARDLAHAPSHQPHTVPHEFVDVEHAVSHLEGVRKERNLRCLVVLDDVWDAQIVPLFLCGGFHSLVTTRDLAVIPRDLQGVCTEVEMLTNAEALELLKNASRATAAIPTNEGLKVAKDCGFLPLPLAIVGAMGSSRADPDSAETWRGIHALLQQEPELVQDPVGSVLAVSFCGLKGAARTRFRKLGVLAKGARAPVDMVAHLWELDHDDSTLLLDDLVDKSLVKVEEHAYYLHDLVLDFAKDELRKLKERVRLVTCRQAQYLGRMSVVKDYAKAGEVMGGFYALMALWRSVEDLSGDNQLEASTYGATVKPSEESEASEDVAYLTWAVGRLFELQGKFAEAEELYDRCQAINEEALGPEHPSVATTLHGRAGLMVKQGKLAEAEALYDRCQAIEEKVLDPEHPSVATTLHGRAGLMVEQGKLAEAEALYDRCQAIEEKVLGPEHPSVAATLHSRAGLMVEQGKLAEAEALYDRCQAIDEKVLGPEHPSVATTLHNRACLLEQQGKLAEAEALYDRCQAIEEKVLGPEHPSVATTLHNRACLLEQQGKLAEAEALYDRCQAIEEKVLGPEHPSVATTLHNRAGLLEQQGKLAEAEALYDRCQAMKEKVLGPEHPSVATTLHNRAGLMVEQGKLAEAEALYDRCQAIEEKVLGPEHPSVATTLHNRAGLMVEQGKLAEAEALYDRCQAIEEKVLGPEHPSVATTLHNRAGLMVEQGKLAEAEALYDRCQAMKEKVLGPEHPSVATTLHGRAGLMVEQGKLAEAEALYDRCQAMKEKVLGPEHSNVATTLHSRAGLMVKQGKRDQAVPLLERAFSIRMKALGSSHPDTIATQNQLEHGQ
ncbi:NB-ARC and TPR repeat-containing protein [Ectocarpus siliculosus]|uniref:NB-ARC and TPR repeat-containing protein n=1 Tax=Ectocarpus siliculosus TaxID=2880 RepID=D8LL58_ECTSI|nr:NB-ARC and TPR repeat-containing protein [Ectocarpus siliculosus]|eukprot:CBN79677.1 NB-ARC and TPR repeat-containing protein [Ectocarpus siliculosus]